MTSGRARARSHSWDRTHPACEGFIAAYQIFQLALIDSHADSAPDQFLSHAPLLC